MLAPFLSSAGNSLSHTPCSPASTLGLGSAGEELIVLCYLTPVNSGFHPLPPLSFLSSGKEVQEKKRVSWFLQSQDSSHRGDSISAHLSQSLKGTSELAFQGKEGVWASKEQTRHASSAVSAL